MNTHFSLYQNGLELKQNQQLRVFLGVNFLAHYYFDHKKNYPYYNLGLLLPDLIRNFSKVIHHLPENIKTDNFRVKSLADGFEKHLAADRIFHRNVDFVSFIKQITQLLRNSGQEFPRDWFLAHILTELLLDRAILISHPQIANELYADIDLIDPGTLKIFLNEAGMNDQNSFDWGFQNFKEVRYLNTYNHPESIAYALTRIAEKVSINISGVDRKYAVVGLVHELEPKFVSFMNRLELLLK